MSLRLDKETEENLRKLLSIIIHKDIYDVDNRIILSITANEIAKKIGFIEDKKEGKLEQIKINF